MLFEAKFKATHEEGLKILTSKQTHQKLPKALTQVKTGNTFENVINEIRQIMYSLHQAK